VPHERIRNADEFDDPDLPGSMQTTVSLRAVSCGTDCLPLPVREAAGPSASRLDVALTLS
jgi:hypothetical protein